MPPPYSEKSRPHDGYIRQKSFDSGGRPQRQPPAFRPPNAEALTRKPTYARGAPIHRGATQRRGAGGPNQTEERGMPPGLAGQQGSIHLQRGKTLTRPDRFVAPTPLISAPAAITKKETWFKPWSFFCYATTFWAPAFLLSACGMKDKLSRQAWREKVGLCAIVILLGGVVGFATIGLNRVLCPSSGATTPDDFIHLGDSTGTVGIAGWQFNITQSVIQGGVNFFNLAKPLAGIDVTDLFDQSQVVHPSCNGQTGAYATANLCASNTSASATATCPLGPLAIGTFNNLKITNTTKQVGWAWDQVSSFPGYMVIDGVVLNMNPYMALHPLPIANDPVDAAIRAVLVSWDPSGGKDATKLFYQRSALKAASQCITDRYRAGHIDKITPGCFFSQLFLYTSLCVIMGVVLCRFAMAVIFNWFLSRKLVQAPKNLNRRHGVSPAVMPAGANVEVDNQTGTAPWTAQTARLQCKNEKSTASKSSNEKSAPSRRAAPADADGMINMAAIGAELFCACLVTCYSEDEESIKGTLDSIAATDYADARKMLFIVADGMITGSGEKRSTPDICVGLLDADPRFGNPTPMSYLAIAAGRKQHNQALVYAGHYTRVRGRRTPAIIVVKCGTPEEAHDKKAGNRGKRDSQMILMNFFSRVTYNDRMTPLDYDLFRKVHALMGVTPDFFEVTLMVDADTRIYRDSLTQLVNCMHYDNRIMGVCGETRLANKRDSWVTAIQVFEYFISHHLAKAFESVFGGVTCLPGCFSMYRLKARKANDSDWVPILIGSEICREYSQSVVTTLHEKNLLLLGEDRFLSTLMLRTFPARKMLFCPQARCKTVAPDSFRVLLSQRRRWINSTIHNLMELMLVRNLCGTFCFSMQFVVSMELIGTSVLPVAICLTYTLIINYCFNPPTSFSDAIPLLLLAGVLGLPAVLIMLTTRKWSYLFWMLIYLLALPIWNFVLPVYAFWHFDDFSWGETRKVLGEGKDKGHGANASDSIEVNAVPLRRWDAWEKSRLRKLKRDLKRRKEFERQFGSKLFHNGPQSDLGEMQSTEYETASQVSREDDRWGQQIQLYNEGDSANAPPPVGLFHIDSSDSINAQTIDKDQMAQMLDEGWSDEDEDSPRKQAVGDVVQYQSIDSRHSPVSPMIPPSPYHTSYADSHHHAASSSSLLPARSPSPLRPVYNHQSYASRSADSSSHGHSDSYERHGGYNSHARNRSSGNKNDFAAL